MRIARSTLPTAGSRPVMLAIAGDSAAGKTTLTRGLVEAIGSQRVFTIELLYTDHEGGQRTIGMFTLASMGESHWLCSMVRHWNLDRPDPR